MIPVRVIVAALLVAASAIPATARASEADVADAIAQFVNAETNSFAGLQGKQTNDDGTYVYYDSSVQIPGSSACAIYTYKKTGDKYGTCDFAADTEQEARTYYDALTKIIQKIEPGWEIDPIDPPPHGHLVALIAKDPQNTRGIYLYVDTSDPKNIRVTTTFGTPAALKS